MAKVTDKNRNQVLISAIIRDMSPGLKLALAEELAKQTGLIEVNRGRSGHVKVEVVRVEKKNDDN